ncbi:dihydrofolate reductase [Methylobacillus rhizosphaerae]|uniref:Dihydrofolate reductase n=1 Tax=Methylobacillus rhizosphaerae TaxID=551994 RepID=A0A238YWQ8_9PROT|nr:dihydrofolate reductase [Methylobacillus rhizosphaerae]SNR75537.1 dihydrofolate reductase [Methylobacillus rhizosphaerae]
MANLSLIVAVAHRRVIGLNNTLPWHLPEDLKRFRALTTGHHIIMGRKTYESLNRLLPDRTTVIVTRNQHYAVPGALIASSLEQAIEFTAMADDDEAFLIGGAELYQEGLRLADRLYITEIDAEFAGDAFLPEFDLQEWQETGREELISAKGLPFRYLTYERKA